MGFIKLENPVVGRIVSGVCLAALCVLCALTAYLPSKTTPLGDPEADAEYLEGISAGDTAWVSPSFC
jgi:hypothetical protein